MLDELIHLARGAESRRGGYAQLRKVIEVLPEGMAYYDADDRIVIWNERYAELNSEAGGIMRAGTAFRDLLITGLHVGIYPEAAGRETEWLEERLARRRNGETIEQENKGRWLRIVERRTADGGTVSVCEDITELKQREASFRLMFDNNPVPMWVADAETKKFIAVNEAAVVHYGYSRERMLEMTFLDLLVEEELAPARAISGREHYRAERSWRQRKADGTVIDVLPYVQRLEHQGRPAVMAAMFDVTVRKRAEEAVAEARDAAEAASRAKGAFLANMSHEIRTPLNGVTGIAQVLARTQLTPEQREMVGVIACSAQTLERLLSDILDLSRVEAGRMGIDAEPFRLEDVVRATAALSELRAREKSLPFRLEIAEDARRDVVGDAGRLKQILHNLLSNAVKFTKAGEVGLSVTVEAGDPDVFVFAVRDTGVGFDPEAGERLFKRFEQRDGSITREFGGTGLGLAISRDLADLMGGALTAESAPGRGSTFTLRLPLPTAETAVQPEWEAAPAFMESEGRPLRVLLAEDHPTNQKVVELLLATMGAELTCVDNGQEAVRAVAEQPFDVVLMDMQMPVMDGLTAIRLIRKAQREAGGPATPIYTLSANAMTEHAEASMAAGADKHLTKPISAAVLLGALGEVAEQVALREAA